MKHFYKNILFYVIVPCVVFLFASSYYRFVVKHDYMVGYDGACDPSSKTCFVGYEDGDPEKMYYYSKMQKYAPDLYGQCGEDITDCEAASVCFLNDRECSVEYCDPEKDGELCETITEDSEI